MGYNTNYKLYSTNESVLESIIEDEDMELSQNKGVKYAFLSAKWYEHEEEMREISSRYKGVLFTLHGEGEEGGDLWRKYFLNGKMQKAPARIEYDDFDSSKLT